MDLWWRVSTGTRRVIRKSLSGLKAAMKVLIFFVLLAAVSTAIWFIIPLLQGRDADFETRLALFQGRGGDFVATPSEATPTPGTEPSEDPLPDHLGRVLLDHARTGEEGAGAKVAEAPPPPPADRPSPADMDSARAERLQTAGTEPSEEAGTAPAYKVQLAAVRSLERAQGEWERLRRKNSALLGNLTLSVTKADLGPKKGVFYRLRAGPVADEAAARALCAKLARHRMACLVVRPGG